ncbi:FAD/NAD-P-binding domain-containing protein [Coprinellus micaceus]|uniref:FAD/NAD-P-binding domain-containing protein n=1 Tax=Coprinellus micaceus TaxID=71717 RepID=A0A4Y7SH32_COPMI|nr:FAD/NAD-P-binding domain-containing protein [Coprinellus micaceus]
MASSTEPMHPAEAVLPTLRKLGISEASKGSLNSLNPIAIAERWVADFAKATAKSTLDIASLVTDILLPSTLQSTFLCPDSELDKQTGLPPAPKTGDKEAGVYWRDALALTWDFRTFEGTQKIQKFLEDKLAQANIRNIKVDLSPGSQPKIQQVFDDLIWLQILFTFDTDVGGCTGVARLVPISVVDQDSLESVKWKTHTVFTRLESLHGVPELLGPLREQEPYRGPWNEKRAEEKGFKDRNPTVLIVGAGQSGLGVSANLKVLGIDSLMIERAERVGDNWRKRYEALCLHDPVWYDHMPFIPFPKTWPVYTPARKLGNWLESYVDSLDLNVWTSSTVTKVEPTGEGSWSVTVVSRGNEGKEDTRIFRVKHVVFASGWRGNPRDLPIIPGRDKFKGRLLHSSQHSKAVDHQGKKVVVVGACTSAFDISVDLVDHGVDTTMFQRSSSYIISSKGVQALLAGLYSEETPYPTDVADRLNLSLPNQVSAGAGFRARKLVGDMDKETIRGLEAQGFHCNKGYRETGLMFLVWVYGGGYYMDAGGSQYIIDGRLKVKGDCGSIKECTEHGLKFEDGSELPADVVIFCTGYSEAKEALGSVLDQEVLDKCSPLWGLNDEGELLGVHREIGPRGLWSMMGNLALCRMHSKHVALQIAAIQKGIFGERYSA